MSFTGVTVVTPRCPHCHNPIEVVEDSTFADVPAYRGYYLGFRVAQVALPVKKPASGAESDSR